MPRKPKTPEQRERRRLESAAYRLAHPDRVADTRARFAARPGGKERDRERAAQARLTAWSGDGPAPWVVAADHAARLRSQENAAQLQAAGAAHRANETPAERAARLAPSQSASTAEKKSRTNLAKGAAYHSALVWQLWSPAGVLYRFKNLAAFVREHRELFTEEQLQPVNAAGRTRIESAIAALSPRRKHCVESCCGWRWAGADNV